jgi:hypothetical protein
MTFSTIHAAAAVLMVASAIMLGKMAVAWARYRGERLILCPENCRPAGVRVDALHASGAALAGAAELRLSDCSRWPERAGCGQECLSQIQTAPEECLVRHKVTQWYEDKLCVSCGQRFEDVSWNSVKPALLVADKVTVGCNEIPVAELPDTLNAALPICFACHMANKLVQEHPELATDRSWPYFRQRSTGHC